MSELSPTLGSQPPRRPLVRITERDLKELSEYSASMPTGTYIGKRWKREVAPVDDSDNAPTLPNQPLPTTFWVIGEYYDVNSDKEVGIRWSDVLIVEIYDTEEPKPTRATGCLCHDAKHRGGACPPCIAWRWRNER